MEVFLWRRHGGARHCTYSRPLQAALKASRKATLQPCAAGEYAHPILCCASRCTGGGVKADVWLHCLAAQSQELSCVVSSTRVSNRAFQSW